MFSKLKRTIYNLAKNAVFVAETELGSGRGQEKKKIAIDYIISHLPFSDFVKNIIALFLSKFIDSAIETAVEYMNSLPKIQGE